MLALTASATAHAAAVDPVSILADFADPEVLSVGATYYAYSTNQGAYGNVPTAKSARVDGGWTRVGDALPQLPSWAKPGRTWAPGVAQVASNRYVLYFTAWHRVSGRQCIGAATATKPTGPFVPTSQNTPLVCPLSQGGAIDASTFRDSDGRFYLLYKNDGNAVRVPSRLYLQQLNAAGTGLLGTPTALLSNTLPMEEGVVEAPLLVKRGGRYVLFYSGGSYAYKPISTYFTGYATATTLRGPYTKAYRPLATTQSVDRSVNGPGGQAVITTPSGDYLAIHGWRGTDNQRNTYVAALGFVNGYPVMRGSRVRYEAESGIITAASVLARAGASMDKLVGMIDYSNSAVELNKIWVPRPGAYSVFVGYDAGLGEASHRVFVNGSPIGTVNYLNTGWGNYRQARVDVTLNQGWNRVKLARGNRWAQVDFLEVR